MGWDGLIPFLGGGEDVAPRSFQRGQDPVFALWNGFRRWGVGGTWYGWLSNQDLGSGTIVQIATPVAGGEIGVIVLPGGLPQTHFTSLTCSLGVFLTASATYQATDTYYGSNFTSWRWAVGPAFPASGTESITFA
jgi:hypothetical protein